ncbi:MAG TPA: PAS domain S-box protein, partial [Acidimicrobiia bacterium]|nr:PAS domain S-box protein [Acidimicrobiia bacterium]
PGTQTGVLLARTPVELVTQAIQARPLGASARAFVVDQDGRIVAHPERNRVLRQERYPVERLLSEGTGTGFGSGNGGVLSSAAQPTLFPGAVVVEQDEDEALSSASGSIGDLTALLVAVVGAMVLVVVTVVSRALAPLRGLERAVNRLAKGDHSARAPVRGSAEVRLLATEINRMADALEERLVDLEAARREVEEAEERFRTAFELAPVGVALASLEGRYLQVNPALCDLLQRREEQVLGTTWHSLTHPDDVSVSETSLEEALRSGLQRYQVEKRYLRPDGSSVWVLLSVAVVRGPDGRPDHFISHVQDVTPQRRAQEELARLFGQAADAEERLRRVIDGAPDATLVVAGDGRIEFASRKTVDVFGWEPDELVGRSVEVLLPERFRDRHVEYRGGFGANPRSRQMGAGLELSGLRADGTEFPVEVALSPLQTDDGLKVIAAVRDVTERRVAQAAAQALHEARVRQRQAMEVNDTIVQGLTVARWSLEMGEETRALEALERSLFSARGLIGDMLMEASPDGLRPGDLVRERPADLS